VRRWRWVIGSGGASRNQFWESKGNRSGREGGWVTTISGGGEGEAVRLNEKEVNGSTMVAVGRGGGDDLMPS
jgi:hypothetical protein